MLNPHTLDMLAAVDVWRLILHCLKKYLSGKEASIVLEDVKR
jgi:hypothetical protein